MWTEADDNQPEPLKAFWPMLVTPLPMLIEVKLLQPLMAFSPMLVTLFGIVIEVKLVKLSNA